VRHYSLCPVDTRVERMHLELPLHNLNDSRCPGVESGRFRVDRLAWGENNKTCETGQNNAEIPMFGPISHLVDVPE
jgi:hypothetical protein